MKAKMLINQNFNRPNITLKKGDEVEIITTMARYYLVRYKNYQLMIPIMSLEVKIVEEKENE